MRISVVLTTYNGEKYIGNQFLSIINQTKQIDEILVFDDASTDKTVDVVKKIACEYDVSNCVIKINEKNLGWKKNFIHALKQASGDVIFLADQDDIWHSQKVERMCQIFEIEQKANLVVCGFEKFWGEDSSCEQSFPNLISGKVNYKKMPNKLSNWNIPYPGCTFALKKSFFSKIKSAWFDDVAHDFLIYEAAWLSDSIFVSEEKLHFFRRHSSSATTNSPPMLGKQTRIDYLTLQIRLIDNLFSCGEMFHSNRGIELKKWLAFRKNLIQNRSLYALCNLLIKFSFYKTCRTFFTDGFVSLKRI